MFRRVSQRVGARGSALPAGRDSDAEIRIFTKPPLEPFSMFEVQEHARTHTEDGAEDYPKIVRQADDWIRSGVDIEDCHEEREREGEECHDGEHAHRLVLFGREERIIGLAQFMQRFCGAHDVIVHAVIFVGNGANVGIEIIAEELRSIGFEITQDFAMRLDALA